MRNNFIREKNVDAWMYPLFFTSEKDAWQSDIQKINLDPNAKRRKVTRNECMRYFIFPRKNTFNVYLRGKRLFHQFLVTSHVNIEKERLSYLQNHQKKLRVDHYLELKLYLEKFATRSNKQVGKLVILPSTFLGSPRNMQQLYQDSMAQVRTFDKPDLFITMTCNPNWSKIGENLLEVQEPHDRPDLIAKVFNIKKMN